MTTRFDEFWNKIQWSVLWTVCAARLELQLLLSILVAGENIFHCWKEEMEFWNAVSQVLTIAWKGRQEWEDGDASRAALQHMAVLLVMCGWGFWLSNSCRVITLVFICQELSCCLPGIWCPRSCAQRAILGSLRANQRFAQRAIPGHVPIMPRQWREEFCFSCKVCWSLLWTGRFLWVQPLKQWQHLVLWGRHPKECHARKLINNNNTVKKP